MGTLPEDLKDLEPNQLVDYSDQLGEKFGKDRHVQCGGFVEKGRCTTCNKKVAKRYIVGKVTTSQLRGIFNDIKRIQLQWKQAKKEEKTKKEEDLIAKLHLLKPRMVYAVGKANKQKSISELINEIECGIDGVVNSENKKEAADNFFKFVEAVVAYHKYHGGD